MKNIEKVLSFGEKIIQVFGILSGVVVQFINVILRNLGSSLTWAEEYARFAIIWITFAGCGAAVKEKAHMNISALYDVLGSGGKFALEIFFNSIGLAFSGFMFYYGVRLTEKTIQTMQVSPTMMLPMWIVYISVPVGGALMILRYITIIVASIKNGKEL